jgi:hypothetical protein
MNRKYKSLVLLFGLSTSSIQCFSATTHTGAAFLSLGGGARPAAMQGAYTAAAGDLDSIYYNPGGLAALGTRSLSLTHAEWILGSNYDVLSYGNPTSAGTWGVSVTRLTSGAIEGRDEQRRPTGKLESQDLSGSIAFGKNFGSNTGVGVNIKYISSRIAGDSASSAALDVGAVGRLPGKPLWLGISILNIGPGLRFINRTDDLPLMISVGGVAQIGGPFKLALDVKHDPHNRTTNVVSGIEYSLISSLSLRAGYGSPWKSSAYDRVATFQNFTGGIGLKMSTFQIDYTAVPFGDVGLTHRFTLSSTF